MAELRFTKEGIPIYDGSSELYIPYRRAALNYVETLEWRKRSLAGPRLLTALEGPARVATQHQEPGWISHERGAQQLLDFLKGRVQAPTLAEAGKTISKFFYQVKRRRGESMNAWIVRHDEALYEARRTLAEAIQEYGPEYSTGKPSTVRSEGRRSTTPSVIGSGSRRDASPRGASDFFDEHGRLREDDPSEEAEHTEEQQSEWQDPWWQQQSWWSWNESHHQGNWQWNQWRDDREWRQQSAEKNTSLRYDVSARASEEADKFLPDFAAAWMLLQRSGLDGAERATMIASLKNQFSTRQVKEALRLNWTEEDLKRRDQNKSSAMIAEETEDAVLHDEEHGDDAPEWFDEDEKEAYSYLTAEAEQALQAIHQHRRTLREAREKQSMMRKSRHFFPIRKESTTRWKSESEEKCYKCGGKHRTSACPQKEGHEKNKGAQGVHFTFVTSPEVVNEPGATALTSESEGGDGHVLSMQHIVDAGKAIIDGGATSSVGSVDAMEQIRKINQRKGISTEVDLKFDEAPSFRFGNNGRTTCLSTAQLNIPLAQQHGKMKIHVHEIPQQPILLSIQALRTMGAVIDFERDECIFRNIDPSRVVKLERAASGHQVFPLTEDVYSGSSRRVEPFVSLQSDAVE